ncbi:MAG: hypothetical protein LBH57_08125 [Treponema sp.]|nr:hypothetical protein [Treponema sp.]
MLRRVLLALWLLTALTVLSAQESRVPAAGDAAVAERYADWAVTAISDGRWAEAGAALERARDFADVSSDLSYLLALVRSHENRPGGAVLDAVRRGLDTDRWNRYSAVQARLLEAETLLRVRAFTETLRCLAMIPDADAEWYGAGIACFRLRALLGLRDIPSFHSAMALALEQYSRDPEPARILLRYAARTTVPEAAARDLVETVLKRLPLLLDKAPDLAYLAAPFMRDTEEAGRFVAAYRALGSAAPESIPAALNLGVIDDDMAVEELFRRETLDKDLLLEVWKLLRGSGGREVFGRNLSLFSGVIQEDADYDGYAETRTRYAGGAIEEYIYDADQDGIFEWHVFWNAGIPVRAGIAVSPEGGTQGAEALRGSVRLPLRDADLPRASITWERYPSVLSAGFEGLTYRFNPLEFAFSPLLIAEIPEDGGLPYPERDPRGTRLTGRTLASFAAGLERPGREFPGALELVTLERGVPRRAAEYLEGRAVSVTEFLRGRPVVQRIDLDLDGRMETIRRFRVQAGPPGPEEGRGYVWIPESSESDWDGDGIYETGEEYLSDGSIARSWDLDKNGNREYTVIIRDRTGKN